MKSITYAEKSWLLGDAAADAVVEYAVLLAKTNSADSVDLQALSADGAPHLLTLVIGPATMMTAASEASVADEPDNEEAVAIIHERMRVITHPPISLPAGDVTGEVSWEDLA